MRPAQAGEAASLTALCRRSKAHWGYDAAFMLQSAQALTVHEDDIATGRVLVAVDAVGRVLAVARVEPDGELGLMFVDPPAIGSGVGKVLFEGSVALARGLGARRMAILADPNAARFYERLGARFVADAPSDAIPGRTLPLYEYDLIEKEAP